MRTEEGAQRTVDRNSSEPHARPRPWMRWLKAASRGTEPDPHVDPLSAERLDVHAALRLLPKQLESSSIPNGVVELVIDDSEAPTRQLFDIHNGRVELVEPGAAVPWASISGPATAWAVALGPERDVAELQLTGDQRLAARVLAALPRRD